MSDAVQGADARLLYRPVEAQKMLGIGQTKFFDLVRSGALKTCKLGSATVVTAAELQRFVASLSAGGGQ